MWNRGHFGGPLFVVIFGILFQLLGCGSLLGPSTKNYYYYPSWTPDGKILATKEERTVSGGSGGLISGATIVQRKWYLVTMTEEGTNEANVKEISDKTKSSASPLGNYIAYTENDKIKIINASAGTDVNTINAGGTVDSLDWSPDEGRVVYRSNGNLFLSDRGSLAGTKIFEKGGEVAWKYGEKIIHSGGSVTGDIFPRIASIDGANLSELIFANAKGGEPNISGISSLEVIYRSSNQEGIKKINLGSMGAEPLLLVQRNDLWNIKLSPNATKIVATGNNIDGEQIWLINIDGSGLKQII